MWNACRAHIFVAILLASSGASASAGQAQRLAGPFGALAGGWSGSGTISTRDGNRERIRCRARYSVSRNGDAMAQDLRCASDSYRIEVTSDIQSDNGALSGEWTERERNVTGTVSGRVAGGSIKARVVGQGFAASVTVNTNGNAQSVTIVPDSNGIRSVAVIMRRG
jgi:hypothetical protein